MLIYLTIFLIVLVWWTLCWAKEGVDHLKEIKKNYIKKSNLEIEFQNLEYNLQERLRTLQKEIYELGENVCQINKEIYETQIALKNHESTLYAAICNGGGQTIEALQDYLKVRLKTMEEELVSRLNGLSSDVDHISSNMICRPEDPFERDYPPPDCDE
jgi:hypothetical protein